MKGLIRLVDVPEYAPHGVRIVGNKILCRTWPKPATTLHLVPDGDGGHYLQAGCEDHDPGWYWFEIKDLADRLEEWLPHLAEKRGHMAEALISGLGLDGLKAILQMRDSR